MSANVMNKIKHRLKPNDRIYTPPKIVDIMLDFCDYKKGESVLEGAKGKGAIYDKLSEPKEYCEIKIPNWFQRAYIIVCEKLDKEPDNIIFKSIHIGNKCLHCGQPVGGMKRSKTVKHCKRKASENECHY